MNETMNPVAYLSDREMRRRAGDLEELLSILDRLYITGAPASEIARAEAAVCDSERLVADAIERRQQHREANPAAGAA